MVRKGEILSQAVSNVSDEILDGARELFEKSEEEISQAQELYDKKRQAVKKKIIYAMSAAAAACIFIVAGITFLSAKQGIPKVYYKGMLLDANGVAVDTQADDEPDVVSYSLKAGNYQKEYEFTFSIKARGSFIIEASSGVLMPDGSTVMPAEDEADVIWNVEPYEGAYLTVSAGKSSVRIELHLDEETNLWMLRTSKGKN